MSATLNATALILAASRAGPGDAVAKLQGVSHKCLIDLDGERMLERVVRELEGCRHISRIFISIEDEKYVAESPVLKEKLAAGKIHVVPSADNLYLSVIGAAESIEAPWPLVITTGDNALHTTEMVDHFCEDLVKTEPDVAVAMTPAAVILDAYPDGKRAFHELKDGGWSSCNLYSINSPKALQTAKVFEGGGQFGKKPERILKAFGLTFMLLYKFKLATIDGLAARLSRRWDIAVNVVRMPFADAPIDVDNPGDVALTERILKARHAN